ncbi:RING-H2 finger protein ATL16-like [Curcuma longa]|uniref:RING-H2 finger protein ATL16-like n=1 Tax=Curcuma longa TaxID=136217 RepID=UPI003D9DFBFC
MDPVHGHNQASALPLLPSSSSTFPFLAITALGILLISAVLLLSYYVFVVKCCLDLPSHRRGGHRIPPEVCGLEPAIIRSIPVIKFVNAGGQENCAVCLSEFREEERIKVLPRCSHHFHIDCIDTWLQFNPKCPLCRSEVSSVFPTDHIVVLAPRRDQGEVTETGPVAVRTKGRRLDGTGSVGDERIDVRVGVVEYSSFMFSS